MRRPAAPHLRPGRPGTPTRVVPAPIPEQFESTPAAPHRASPPRTGRRAVLLVGAAAAVGGTVGVGALLRTGGPGAPSAASSEGSGPGGGSATAPFADVAADHPGAEAMRWADETGVQPALSGGGYSPAAPVARGEVALALHRLAGAPVVDLGSLPVLFTDLGEDPARVSALLWLHGRGALWGDAELRVRPDEPATRDCTAMMLTALLRPALAGVGVTWDASAEISLPQAEDPGSALADVDWLEAAGMAPSSLADGPRDAAVTRADLAVSLQRTNTVITDALD
ncbi:MAG: hypothetical protein ACTHV2_11955 [Brachybacterium sp.]|uniref:hypothetical protein n=1 Tax=Brachybacterium sp. TaxID=1891286 RepID=UPI003F8DE7A9